MKGKKASSGNGTKPVMVYLPIEVYGKLAEKAGQEDRSVSKTATRILSDALRNE
jgi:hypothetical protein